MRIVSSILSWVVALTLLWVAIPFFTHDVTEQSRRVHKVSIVITDIVGGFTSLAGDIGDNIG